MKRESFEHLCRLARLDLADSELVEFEKKFERLLGFVEQVQAFEPEAEGPPMTLISKLELRRDNPEQCDWPDFTAHDYRVPKIIDFEGGS